MHVRSVAIVLASILSLVPLGHAEDLKPATYHLVWLITESVREHTDGNTDTTWRVEHGDPPGYPLGVAVFPAEVPLATCATIAKMNARGSFTPSQQTLARIIGTQIDKLIEDPTPLCLTTAEAKALVAAVKKQTDRPPGRDS